jgi:hypothetical protein
MAWSVFGLVPGARRRPEPGPSAHGRGEDSQAAERAYRLTLALAERQAAQDAKVRRWGAYACHIPSDPYGDSLTPTRKRP